MRQHFCVVALFSPASFLPPAFSAHSRNKCAPIHCRFPHFFRRPHIRVEKNNECMKCTALGPIILAFFWLANWNDRLLDSFCCFWCCCCCFVAMFTANQCAKRAKLYEQVSSFCVAFQITVLALRTFTILHTKISHSCVCVRKSVRSSCWLTFQFVQIDC